MNYKIESDGTFLDTKVFDKDTGVQIRDAVRVVLVIDILHPDKTIFEVLRRTPDMPLTKDDIKSLNKIGMLLPVVEEQGSVSVEDTGIDNISLHRLMSNQPSPSVSEEEQANTYLREALGSDTTWVAAELPRPEITSDDFGPENQVISKTTYVYPNEGDTK